MNKKTKNFKINMGFGIPAGNGADGRYQIGPVTCNACAWPRSGGWVLQNDNNNVSNCASNCANNCANNAQSNRGFRRALFASPILGNKIEETVLPYSAGLCKKIWALHKRPKSQNQLWGITHPQGTQPEGSSHVRVNPSVQHAGTDGHM